MIYFFRRLVTEKPLGTVGAVITLILLLTGIFADFIAPYGMNATNMSETLKAPSSEHWFGTDFVGRDIFSRVIFGARISVIIGLAASVIGSVTSIILGMLCGYLGGKIDLAIQRVVDIVMSLPSLILLMVMISIVGPGILQIIFVLGLRYGIVGSRMIRSAVIGIKENVYVEASVASGCSTAKILTRHILPNIMAPAIIHFTAHVPGVIMTEASLSFLGFGIPPPIPSWGGMLSGEGRLYMLQAPWLITWPGLALALVVYGINMFGDAVRDILDPRLRGGVGRYGIARKIGKEAIAKR